MKRAAIVVLGLTVMACSSRGGLQEFAPEQRVPPEQVLARGGADLIRFVMIDSTHHSLFRVRLVRDTIVGTRDAGAPRRIPSDSVAYVEAFIPAGQGGATTGEWFQVGLLASFLGAMVICASGACSP